MYPKIQGLGYVIWLYSVYQYCFSSKYPVLVESIRLRNQYKIVFTITQLYSKIRNCIQKYFLCIHFQSVDALFCNGMTRVGDLSREAILASLRECDLSVLKDEVNKNLFNDKKFCKECINVCVKYTQKLELVEEMIDFLYSASEETRYVPNTICLVNRSNVFRCIQR